MSAKTIDMSLNGDQFEVGNALDGVRRRRVVAFLIDYLLIALLLIPVGLVVFILGLLTIGLGWLLFGILWPLTALSYVAWTLGGPVQATTGMRMAGVRLERLDGGRVDWMLAVVHTVLFWAGNVILSPLVLLVALFLPHKRTLHDLLLGTVVVRAD